MKSTESTDEATHHDHGLHDRVEHLEDKVKDLREIADKGESAATPAILTGGILVLVIPIVGLMTGVVLAIYYLA